MFAIRRPALVAAGTTMRASKPATQTLIVRFNSAFTDAQRVKQDEKRTTPTGVRGKTTIAVDSAADLEQESRRSTYVDALMPRFLSTMEIAVSKIFPAGFGWQGASVLADNAGFAADTLGFYLYTGVGDFAGVLGGHTLYFAGKKALFDKDINMMDEAQTGMLLASAAFGSGCVWQLALNQFQAAGYNFATCAIGTGAVCAATFFGGLRLFRSVYPKLGMRSIEGPTYRNLRDDAALSLAIGGATGTFVGTDISMADNTLRGFVGIEEAYSTIQGMAVAGKSTAAGFIVVQAAMNAGLPAGRNWLDQEGRE